MQWSEIPFAPPPRTLREFAGLWLLVFGGLGCWQGLVRGNLTLALVFAALAVAVGPLGLLRPQAVRPLFVGSMILTFPIGWAVSRILLALLFYGVFTPVGLFFRVTGRDPLRREHQPGKETYWAPKPAPAGVRSYLRQF